MNIVRGTFRLSILVAVAALGYFWWQATQQARAVAMSNQELWSTLRCAGYLLKLDTSKMENAYGNIDLGANTHCVSRQFWANRREIEEASKRESPYRESFNEEMKWRRDTIWEGAFAMFVLTNLLGFAFLGLRWAYRWVFAGYRRS